jgi:hypothetical protein
MLWLLRQREDEEHYLTECPEIWTIKKRSKAKNDSNSFIWLSNITTFMSNENEYIIQKRLEHCSKDSCDGNEHYSIAINGSVSSLVATEAKYVYTKTPLGYQLWYEVSHPFITLANSLMCTEN